MSFICRTPLPGIAIALALALGTTAGHASTIGDGSTQPVIVTFSLAFPDNFVLSGYLSGLFNNTQGPATGLFLTGDTSRLGGAASSNYNLIEHATTILSNSVTITNGVVTGFTGGYIGPIVPPPPDQGARTVGWIEIVQNINSTYHGMSPEEFTLVSLSPPSFTVEYVPEPASAALFGAALLAIGWTRRRAATVSARSTEPE